jgi:myxalamid-type polyketide synthase MxaB
MTENMAPSTIDDIRVWLTHHIADLLGVSPDEIDSAKSLESFGVASRDAITLVGDLETWTGLSLSPTLVYEYPTIDAIARYVASRLQLDEDTGADAGRRTVPMPELRIGGEDDAIAIVGMGCRFPDAEDLEAFWQLLIKGRDAISEIPADRWDIDATYDPNGGPGKIVSKWGGFLSDIAEFDPAFFGISPREAEFMDPQQRLLLEVSWEAMEHAGIPLNKLRGTHTGIFVGISNHDYLLLHRGDLKELSPYSGVGNAFSIDANRLSFIYDFHGPSVAIDTACSSSLVALHMACQALRSGEADAALAGGVNAILTPETTVTFSQAGMMSPTGRCRTFDASADGYVRSEGAGMVLLKRLADAQRDGDRILAVIRATATNQDGRSNGISAPNAAAQTAVIRTALARAGMSPDDLDYIEAHGTGTRLGDPIEMEGLAGALAGRTLENPCFVGSVKTNVGHMESASGIAGLIKTVLALQHETIPPHIHFRRINPLIPIDEMPVEIPTMAIPWPREAGRTRYAGVSSFGFGGANAFVVLEEAPEQPAPVNEIERPAHVLALSAQTPAALDELIMRYQTWLDAHPRAALPDVAFTANTGREPFSQRVALVAGDREELMARLQQAAAGETGVGVRRGQARKDRHPPMAWLFTGQGAQYPGMGRELYETQPTFRDALDHCAGVLDAYLEKPLLSVIYPDDPDDATIHDTTYTQPALFAIEYALARLWQSWGLQPDYVIGHSVGEYVAAVIAGVMSLEDGLKLIAARGRLMGSLPHDGGMAAVFSDIRTVAAAIAPFMQEVAIAGVNGPKLVVISGKKERIDAITASLKEQGVRVSSLTVSHAFHSPLMDPILDEFEAVAREIEFHTPAIPLISNVTGMAIMPGEIIDAGYWRRHIRMAVQFMAGMQTLGRLDAEVFLEVGPHPTLIGMARRILDDKKLVWATSLNRKKQDWPTILDALAQMYAAGLPVDWAGFDADYQRQRIDLPTYPFQRQRYWHVISLESIAPRELDHAILVRRLRSPLLSEPVFEARISLKTHPWLGDHRIGDHVLFPATAYLELLAGAARMAFGHQVGMLQNIAFQETLSLRDEESQVLQVAFSALNDGETVGQVFALDDADADAWSVKAKASALASSESIEAVDLDQVRAACTDPVDIKAFYEGLASHGLRYGPAFSGVQEAWSGEDQALGRLILPEAAGDARDYLIHPALLDAAFHVVAAALGSEEDAGDRIYLPVAVEQYQVLASPQTRVFWSHAILRPDAPGELVTADVQLLDDAGRVLADVRGLQVSPVSADALLRSLSQQRIGDWLYQLDWRPQPLTTTASLPAEAGWWLIFADQSGLASALAEGLQAGDDAVVMAVPGAGFGSTPDAWTLNPFNPDDFERLLTALQPQYPLPPRGVIFAWGLDEAAEDGVALAGALHLTQKLLLAGWQDKPRLYLLSARSQTAGGVAVDAAASPLWGFGAVAALEHPELAPTLIDLTDDPAAQLSELINELLAADSENRVALRPEGRFVARLARYAPDKVASETLWRLEIPQRGQLGNLTLAPIQRMQPGPGQIEIQVRATGLNFRDVMNAMGLYPGDPGPLGGECAGVVSAVGPDVDGVQVGDAVMGIVPASFASYAVTDARLVVKMPETLDFVEAATIPIAFLTAHYALNRLGGMQAGERMFVHSASGGVGLAAVQLAQRAGVEVFGAAGTDVKRDYLRQIGVKHVYNSRSLDFTEGVLADTNGQGVHLVLNSLAGDYIPANLKMLAQGGRFLEIGKVDIWSPEQMAETRPDIAYHIIALDALSAEQPDLIHEMLEELAAAFTAGELRPLHHTTYPLEQSESAFRFMALAKHIGKIVITQPERTLPDAARPAVHVRRDGAYLITGGLGALGRLVAEWLVAQGAGAVALLSRHTPDAETRAWMDELAADDAQVVHLQADVADAERLEQALFDLQDAVDLPLRGVIHAAGLLDDGVILQQAWERFDRVLRPKMEGAANLHRLTRNADLDFFIMFSSIASLLGSPGQSNYAAANAYLDALAAQRQSRGLPGLSINWGPWAVGMAAEDGEQGYRSGRGLWPIPPEAGLQALDALLNAAGPQVAVMAVNWPAFLQSFRQAPPLLSGFVRIAPAATEVAQRGPSAIIQQLQDSAPDDRQDMMVLFLRQQVQRILGLPTTDQVDAYTALSEMGMDSLMAVELKNALDEAMGKNLPATIAFEYPTINAIAAYLLQDVLSFSSPASDETMMAEPSSGEAPTASDEADDLPDLDELSEEEIEALLMEKLDDLDDLEDS